MDLGTGLHCYLIDATSMFHVRNLGEVLIQILYYNYGKINFPLIIFQRLM